jgi:hypothetical protein
LPIGGYCDFEPVFRALLKKQDPPSSYWHPTHTLEHMAPYIFDDLLADVKDSDNGADGHRLQLLAGPGFEHKCDHGFHFNLVLES